jgi:hypothetical protein
MDIGIPITGFSKTLLGVVYLSCQEIDRPQVGIEQVPIRSWQFYSLEKPAPGLAEEIRHIGCNEIPVQDGVDAILDLRPLLHESMSMRDEMPELVDCGIGDPHRGQKIR